MKTILFLLIGNIRYDGRVLKEIATLRSAGHKVVIIISDFDLNDDIMNYDFDIIILKRKYGKNPIYKLMSTFIYFFKIRKCIKNNNPDILHCNDLNTLMFSYGLPRKIEIIYDSHELYLEIRHGIVRLFWSMCEKIMIKRAKYIIVPQIDRLYYMHFRYSLPLDKFRLIENFPRKSSNLSSTFFEDKFGISVKDKCVISYLGAITPEREIDILIQSVQSIENICLFIIGNALDSYKKKLEEMISDLNLNQKVFLLSAIPNIEVLHAVNSSDIGVCFYNEKHLNSYFCASNKLYEYLNLGLKVLTNNTAGVARIIKHKENGYCCDILNVEEVKKGIVYLMSMKNISRSDYYWENQEKNLLSIYK